ncbi:hypothetical protein H6P81_012299 [Aristolochia fimbriata]|uniref:Uncharacterized protein n=1 Tax=Aristolochia fimbriata TaxID=158543 RepID=A0AAV7EE71_ARIFI|nr:hypothetical protein H6P81_012299 [Aristolochia fimbriata]
MLVPSFTKMPSSLIFSTAKLVVYGPPKLPQLDVASQYYQNKFHKLPTVLRFSVSDSYLVGAHRIRSARLIRFCSSKSVEQSHVSRLSAQESEFRVAVGNPHLSPVVRVSKMSLGDQAFFLLSFIAFTTSIAFTSLVVAAVPTLYAMARAATSLSKLADTAREELPSTMAAIRLSGMEISDLTLELSDLSQEIADGVTKSAQAVQAAEAGIRQIGALARQQTISMIQERASLPIISLQPVVAGAARKTSRAMGQARKTFMNIISRSEQTSESGDPENDRLKP